MICVLAMHLICRFGGIGTMDSWWAADVESIAFEGVLRDLKLLLTLSFL